MLRYIPYTKNALQSHMRCRASLSVWGEMRDLNSRPPGPQPGALPTELISPCEKGTYTIDGLLASIFSKRTEFSQCFTRFSFWIFSGRTRIPLKNHAPASSGPFVSQSVAGNTSKDVFVNKLIIEGGIPLNGEIDVNGSKNAALPILLSSILLEAPQTFKNVPESAGHPHHAQASGNSRLPLYLCGSYREYDPQHAGLRGPL